MTRHRILVVEDGQEYIDNLSRFLSRDFDFVRAGDGYAALECLMQSPWDAIFLDMKFDRAPRLLGDLEATIVRFAGDKERAKRFLENNQGTYILAEIRDAGFQVPAIFSYDFDGEPRRFQNLQRRHGPLTYLSDTASPADIRTTLLEVIDCVG